MQFEAGVLCAFGLGRRRGEQRPEKPVRRSGAGTQRAARGSVSDGETEALRGGQARFLAFSRKCSCFLSSRVKPSERGAEFLDSDVTAEAS